jgi:hypothetical protein
MAIDRPHASIATAVRESADVCQRCVDPGGRRMRLRERLVCGVTAALTILRTATSARTSILRRSR